MLNCPLEILYELFKGTRAIYCGKNVRKHSRLFMSPKTEKLDGSIWFVKLCKLSKDNFLYVYSMQ